MHKSSTIHYRKQCRTVLNKICGWILMREQQLMNFFTGASIILARSDGFNILNRLDGFVSYKHAVFHFTKC